MVWVYIIGGCIVLFVLLLLLKLKIHIHYYHEMDDDQLEVTVYIWWMKVYSFSAPVIKFNMETLSLEVEEKQKVAMNQSEKKGVLTPKRLIEDLRKFRDFLQHVVGLHTIVRRFLKKVRVKQLKWHSALGIEDAAHTAQLAGAVWSLKSVIVGVISHYTRLEDTPQMTVEPRYQIFYSHTKLSCMISFRLGQAILAGLMLVKHWRRKPSNQQAKSVEENI
ncbi:DUF2953 domain-containing protein [Halalkalibacter hemicellulosilyticus]|uniref:Secreted protein n=1 Tax=Halalkalibacter hemicellulosilyticusJCM 9152 TaxID=1236971 RepID=W4QFH6_9BACI|nr:DUF2953 domain-containing protein [Halalkalibacter hemicellulosilyticus]GAE30089.1 hypothetical protein JCM9152_1485 [Halalkalibacter hemicellulosilyticusJCM 9152]